MAKKQVRVDPQTMRKIQQIASQRNMTLSEAAASLVRLGWNVIEISAAEGRVTVLVDGEPHHIIYD